MKPPDANISQALLCLHSLRSAQHLQRNILDRDAQLGPPSLALWTKVSDVLSAQTAHKTLAGLSFDPQSTFYALLHNSPADTFIDILERNTESQQSGLSS